MSLKENVRKQLAHKEKNIKKLSRTLKVPGKKVQRVLDELVQAGEVCEQGGLYSLASAKPKLVQGILVKLGTTFGFVQANDKSADIFVAGRYLMGAMPGDEVLVKVHKKPRVEGSREGEVHKILQEQNRVVGLVEKDKGHTYLLPDNANTTRLLIPKNADDGVRDGEKIAGEIVHRADRHDGHRVAVTLHFGDAQGAKECASAVLYAAGVEKRFSAEVKKESKAIAACGVTNEEVKLRRDLRDEIVFTIDSASTKDIDDAISVKRVLDGYRLSVHIADVSHYVRAKSLLDEEAMNRGTSIYYADSVVPMLPKALSNGICSLHEGVDRLCLSCIMTLDSMGQLLDFRFFKTVIRSRVKGVYAEVNTILNGEASPQIEEKYAEVRESLLVLEEIYQKLAILRTQRGDIDIESDEPKLTIDENGRCIHVEKRGRGKAERIIEECMLLANTAAAKQARQLDIPFVYRVHDKPPADRVDALKELLQNLDVPFSFEKEVPSQKELAQLLKKTKGDHLESAVHQGVLRSMAKAAYEAQPKGHYGLALADYAHFTSPIRRYPDLLVHRILSEVLMEKKPENIQKKYANFCEKAAEHASQREVRAQKIERSCDDMYRAEYMQMHIGAKFWAHIVSVTRFGIYVQLENSVEGLLRIQDLFEDEEAQLQDGISLNGLYSKRSYRVGDSLFVQVAAADVGQGNVDFVLAEV